MCKEANPTRDGETNSGTKFERQPKVFDFDSLKSVERREIHAGDQYTYQFNAGPSDEESPLTGLVVLDFYQKSIQVANVSCTPFDAIEMLYHLCLELNVPMSALHCFEDIRKLQQASKMRAQMDGFFKDLLSSLEKDKAED